MSIRRSKKSIFIGKVNLYGKSRSHLTLFKRKAPSNAVICTDMEVKKLNLCVNLDGIRCKWSLKIREYTKSDCVKYRDLWTFKASATDD